MRTLVLIAVATVLGLTHSGAAGEPTINVSLKTLAGAYGASYGMAKILNENLSIGPDGSVSVNMPMGMNGRAFGNGKITYFSPAGFVVKFSGKQGPVEMKFLFQKGYPKSFFRDDGKAGVSVFTRI